MIATFAERALSAINSDRYVEYVNSVWKFRHKGLIKVIGDNTVLVVNIFLQE